MFFLGVIAENLNNIYTGVQACIVSQVIYIIPWNSEQNWRCLGTALFKVVQIVLNTGIFISLDKTMKNAYTVISFEI